MGVISAVRDKSLTYQSCPDTKLCLGYINSELGLEVDLGGELNLALKTLEQGFVAGG
jgi:hypothetical protein